MKGHVEEFRGPWKVSRHSDALSGLGVPHLLRYNNPMTFKTVSTADQTVQGIGSTILKIRLNDIDFYEFFIIMRNISYEIILGRVFMSHSNMVIDFKNKLYLLHLILTCFQYQL